MGKGTDVKDEGLLEPRDEEVSTLSNGVIDDTAEPVEEDSPLPSVDNVEGGVEDGGANTQTKGGTGYAGQERNCCLVATHFSHQLRRNLTTKRQRDRERGRGPRNGEAGK